MWWEPEAGATQPVTVESAPFRLLRLPAQLLPQGASPQSPTLPTGDPQTREGRASCVCSWHHHFLMLGAVLKGSWRFLTLTKLCHVWLEPRVHPFSSVRLIWYLPPRQDFPDLGEVCTGS